MTGTQAGSGAQKQTICGVLSCVTGADGVSKITLGVSKKHNYEGIDVWRGEDTLMDVVEAGLTWHRLVAIGVHLSELAKIRHRQAERMNLDGGAPG